MKGPLVFIGLFLFMAFPGISQNPRNCGTAIPISNGYYDYPVYLPLIDPTPNEINGNISCLANGETNGRWFEFEIHDSGVLSFNIIPYNITNDYDWALYNLTSASCGDIFTTDSLNVRCNYSNGVSNSGITGANGGPNNQDEPTLNVLAGEFFKLYVSNFTENESGFQINMGSSTCTFNQTIGIDELFFNNIFIGPNPTSGQVSIMIPYDLVSGMQELRVMDIAGRMIQVQKAPFSSLILLDFSNVSSGIYIILITTTSGQHTRRIIVE